MQLSPSPLLKETLQRAAQLQTTGQSPSPEDLISWLQTEADTDAVPLQELVAGLPEDEALELLSATLALVEADPAAFNGRRHAQFLLRHGRGQPPIFDDLHRGQVYTYSHTDVPGPLATRLIAPDAPRAIRETLVGTDVIVDLGHGNFRDGAAYGRAFPHTHAIGVDDSPAAVELAQARIQDLPSEQGERSHVVASTILEFVRGGRGKIAETIGREPRRIGVTASSTLHFTPEGTLREVQAAIIDSIGDNGWYAGLHRTTKDPFGSPGILLAHDDGELVRIHGSDGLARKHWDLHRQVADVERAGGRIVHAQDFSEQYSDDREAHFGLVLAEKNQ